MAGWSRVLETITISRTPAAREKATHAPISRSPYPRPRALGATAILAISCTSAECGITAQVPSTSPPSTTKKICPPGATILPAGSANVSRSASSSVNQVSIHSRLSCSKAPRQRSW